MSDELTTLAGVLQKRTPEASLEDCVPLADQILAMLKPARDNSWPLFRLNLRAKTSLPFPHNLDVFDAILQSYEAGDVVGFRRPGSDKFEVANYAGHGQ